MIVPPPPIDSLGHNPHVNRAHLPNYKSLGYRRTIIPILLTIGVSMFALGASHWFADPDSNLGGQSVGMAIALFVCGAAALAFGVITMLQVKNLLKQQSDEKKAKAAAAAAAA